MFGLLASIKLNTEDELALGTDERARLLETIGVLLNAADEITLEDAEDVVAGADELVAARDDELTGVVPQGAPLTTGVSAAAEPLVPWKPNSTV